MKRSIFIVINTNQKNLSVQVIKTAQRRTFSKNIFQSMIFCKENSIFSICSNTSRRMITSLTSRPLTKHFRYSAHCVCRSNAFIVCRPVFPDNIPPFLRLKPVNASFRIKIFPALSRHHDSSVRSNSLKQTSDYRLCPATHKSKTRKRTMNHKIVPSFYTDFCQRTINIFF